MKALHAIPQVNFTQLYQQEYNELLKHISLTRQHIIITYDICTEGRLNGTRNTKWQKMSNDCGINSENTAKEKLQEIALVSLQLDG